MNKASSSIAIPVLVDKSLDHNKNNDNERTHPPPAMSEDVSLERHIESRNILSSIDTSIDTFSRQEDMVSNPSATMKTCVHLEDQDLNHLLSDLDDILDVQEIQDDFNVQVAEVHREDRNENDMINQSIVLGPQPSVTLVYRVSSEDDGIRSISFRKQRPLQELEHTPILTMTTEQSKTTLFPPVLADVTTPASSAAQTEKENLRRELHDVQLDRDFLEQQLIETRNELETVRISLQKNIRDLEHEVRVMKENKQRLNESRENEALEVELLELAQLAHEQEEELSAKRKKEQRAVLQPSLSPSKTMQDRQEYSPGRPPKFDALPGHGVETSGVGNGFQGHSSQFYQDKIDNLEKKLTKRKFREQLLEKEIRDLHRQAKLESQRFQETQRQVAWFQEELLAMNDEEADVMSCELLGMTPEHEIVAVGVVGRIKDGNCSPFPSTECSARDSKRIRLLHQHRLALEHRVRDLMDEVGTLQIEHGQLQYEYRQQGSVVQQLRQEIKQQNEQHRMNELLLQRQLNEWKDRAATFQKQLQQERHALQELRITQRKERKQWSRQVEELESSIKVHEDKIQKAREQISHERRLHQQSIVSLESKMKNHNGLSKSSCGLSTSNDGSDRGRSTQNETTAACDGCDAGCRRCHRPSSPHAEPRHEIRILKRRIHQMEGDLRSSRNAESSLRNQLAETKKQSKAAREEAEKANNRVDVLRALLDNGMHIPPSCTEKAYEENESFKENCSTATAMDRDRSTRSSSRKARQSCDATNANVTTPTGQDLFSHIKEEPRRQSLKARARLLKMKEYDDASESASVVTCTGASIDSVRVDLELSIPTGVQDIQLKLQQEMMLLKERKEKLRRSSVSSIREVSKSLHHFRSLLSPARTTDDIPEIVDEKEVREHSGELLPEERKLEGYSTSESSFPALTSETLPFETSDDTDCSLQGVESHNRLQTDHTVFSSDPEYPCIIPEIDQIVLKIAEVQQQSHDSRGANDVAIAKQMDLIPSLTRKDSEASHLQLHPVAKKAPVQLSEEEVTDLMAEHPLLDEDHSVVDDMNKQMHSRGLQSKVDIFLELLRVLTNQTNELELRLIVLKLEKEGLDVVNGEGETKTTALAEFEEQYNKIRSGVKSDRLALLRHHETLEVGNGKVKNSSAVYQAEVTSLQSSLASLSAELQEINESQSERQKECECMEGSCNSLLQDENDLKKKPSDMKAILASAKESHDNRILTARLEHNHFEDHIKRLTSEVSVLVESLAKTSGEKGYLASELETDFTEKTELKSFLTALQKEQNSFQTQKAALDEANQVLLSRISELEGIMDEAKKTKDSVQSTLAKSNKQLSMENESLCSELATYKEKTALLESLTTSDARKIEDLTQKIETVVEEMVAIQMRQKDSVVAQENLSSEKDANILNLEVRIQELINSCKEHDECKLQLQSQINEFKRSLCDAEARLKEVTFTSSCQVESCQQRVRTLEEEVASLKLEVSVVSSEKQRVVFDLEQSKECLKTSLETVEKLRKEVENLQASNGDRQAQIDDQGRQIWKMEKDSALSDETLHNLRSILQSKDAEIKRFEEEHNTHNDHVSHILFLDNKARERESNMVEASRKIKELAGELQMKQTAFTYCEDNARKHESRINGISQQLTDLEAELSQRQVDAEVERMESKKEASDLEAVEVDSLKLGLSVISSEKHRVVFNLQQSKECVNATVENAQELRKEVKILEASKVDLQVQICQKDQRISKMEKDIAISEETLQNLRSILHSKDAIIQRLEEELFTHKEHASNFSVLDSESKEEESKLAEESKKLEELAAANERDQESRMNATSLELLDLETELPQGKVDADLERTASKTILDEVDERVLTQKPESEEFTSQMILQESRLAEATNQLTEMERVLGARTSEVEELEHKLKELVGDDARKDIQIQKQVERLSQATAVLSEMEENLQLKDQQIMIQEDRLIQASAALSEMEELIQEKDYQIKLQEVRLAQESARLSEITEALSGKVAEMDEKLKERDLRIAETSYQLVESKELLRLRSKDIEEKELNLKALEAVVKHLELSQSKLMSDVEGERVDKRRLSIHLDEVQLVLSQKETLLARQLKIVAKLTCQGDKWQMELDDLEAANKDLTNRLLEVEQEKSYTQEQFNSHLETLRKKIASLEKENFSSMKSLTRLEEERDLLMKQLVAKKKTSEEFEDLLVVALEEKKAVTDEHKVANLEGKLNRSIRENDLLSDKSLTSKSDAHEAEMKKEIISKELANFAEECKLLADEIVRLKEERNRLMDQVKQLQDEFEELQQFAEVEEHNQKELIVSFQMEREELKLQRDEWKGISESLKEEIYALKMEMTRLKEDDALQRIYIADQADQIHHLKHAKDHLAAEIATFRQNDEYRRELLTDLSTELSLTVSRETKLQLENQELKKPSTIEEITFQSMKSRERHNSFEIDDVQKELEKSSVCEANWLCEIDDAPGERDALKELHNSTSIQSIAQQAQEVLTQVTHL